MAELSWSDINAPVEAYREILSGDEPSLRWEPDLCPVTPGDRVVLTTGTKKDLARKTFVVELVAIDIHEVRTVWRKGVEYLAAVYTVEDNRSLYVAQNNIHIAGRGYTHARNLALDFDNDTDGGPDPLLNPEDIEEQIERELIDARMHRAERRAEKAAANPKKAVSGVKDELNATLPKLSPADQVALLAGIKRQIVEATEGADAA